MKIIIFDLYETLIHEVFFDYTNGLKYIYQNYLSSTVNQEDYLNYCRYLKKLFDEKRNKGIETNFKDEVITMFEKFGYNEKYDLKEIIFCALNKMSNAELFEDTINVLNWLKENGYSIYLLSNSVFSSDILKVLLRQLGINSYFSQVYSSADYGYRKPDKRLFDIVLKDIENTQGEVNKEFTYFVGDNLVADVEGSENSGLKPIWVNRNNFSTHLNCLVINQLLDLKNLL